MRRIARVRIYIEGAIRKFKVFKMLSNTVPVLLVKKVDNDDNILTIWFALVNLGSALIKESNADFDYIKTTYMWMI